MKHFITMVGKVLITIAVLCSIAIIPATCLPVDVDTSKAPDLSQFGAQVKEVLEQWYPKVRELLFTPGYKDPSRIKVEFDPNYDGIAYAAPESAYINGAVNYYRQHQDDIGSLVHEMTHIIQAYNNCPSWITEGIADYIRYFHFERKQMNKPGGYESYDNGFGPSAYFFNYVESQVRPGIVKEITRNCRQGTYQNSNWKQLTGKDPAILWEDMKQQGGGKFTMTVDSSKAPDLKEFGERAKPEMENLYETLKQVFRVPRSKQIYEASVEFDPDLPESMSAAHWQSSSYRGSADYYRMTENMGELAKVMGRMALFFEKSPPKWLDDGLWTYIQDVLYYGKVPRKPTGRFAYRSTYNTSSNNAAGLLNYVHTQVDSTALGQVVQMLWDGTYTDDAWKQITGKGLDTLWDEYMSRSTQHIDGKFKVIPHTKATPDLQDFASRAKKDLEQYYPNLRQVFNIPPNNELTNVDLIFDPKMPKSSSVAWSVQSSSIWASAEYYRDTQDIGQLAEVVGRLALYSAEQTPPSWLDSGLRYYTNKVLYAKAQPTKPRGVFASYRRGGSDAGALLDYVHTRVNASALGKVMQALWDGTYTDDVWKQVTGKDLETLWNDYMTSG